MAHPVVFDRWTGDEIRNVIEALLRVQCVREGEEYTATFKWSKGEGVSLSVTSGSGEAYTEWLPIPFDAVAAAIDHEQLPDKGIRHYKDVVRFKGDDT